MKGVIEKISELRKFSEGKKNNRSWALWGCNISIDGKDYSVASFERKEIIDNLSEAKEGAVVEFELEDNPKYPNTILLNTLKVLEFSKTHPNVAKEMHEAKEKVDWGAKERRTVRQNALRHADQFMATETTHGNAVTEKAYFEFAKKCEEWVYRNE